MTLEGFGKGFGGDLGVIVGFDLATGDLVGVGITTLSETPGLGTRVREPAFRAQFEGMSGAGPFKVTKDGGDIEVVTGATISSRAVAEAVTGAKGTWDEHGAAIRIDLGVAP